MRKLTVRETIRMVEGLGTVNARENRRLQALRGQMPPRKEDVPRPPLRIGLYQDAEKMPNTLYDHVMKDHQGTQKAVWSACGIGEAEWTRFHQNKTLPDEKLLWRLLFGIHRLHRDGDKPLYGKAAEHVFSLIEIAETEGDAAIVPSLETEAMDKLILSLDAAKRANAAAAQEAEERAAEYDADTAQTIRETLEEQAENALMLYIYTHLPSDVRTNADIYHRCGISSDTWTQMKKNLRQPAFPVLARLAAGLRMTADEADALLCMAWAQRSQLAGVLHGMWMGGVTVPEDIDEVLAYWFPEDGDMRLYGDPAVYEQIAEAKAAATDERILQRRKKEKRRDPRGYKADEAILALFREYDEDEEP